MTLNYKDYTIRNAVEDDAARLAGWWNDGAVMAHAGFPMGIGTTPEKVAESLASDSDDTHRRLMIEIDGIPSGEMNYRNMGNASAEIGIKICAPENRDRGCGKILLSMLISSLFFDMGYRKILLDTNTSNTRARHVYERLGFKLVRIRENSWRNQLGEPQSAADYELCPEDFNNFAK